MSSVKNNARLRRARRSRAKIRELGMMKQHQLHSNTSQYGSITRSGRFADLEDVMKAKMNESLEEIRSGAFAREWSSNREANLKMLEEIRAIQGEVPLIQWELAARRAFRIGDVAQEE